MASSMSTPACAASTRGPARSSVGRGRRHRVAGLPAQQRPVGRVPVEQVGEQRRAGPEQARPRRPARRPAAGAPPGAARRGRPRAAGCPGPATSAPWTAIPPSSLRSASASQASRYAASPARATSRRRSPRSSRPVCSLASARMLVGVHDPAPIRTTVRPDVSRAAWSASAGPTSSMPIRRPTYGRTAPPATSSQQPRVHPLAGLGRERVDAELPEAARRVEVGEEHAHHRQVEHRGLAEGPPGEAGLRVVVEPDGEVSAAPGGAGPDRLGLLTPDRVEDDVGAPVGRVVHDRREHVVRAVVEDEVGAEVAADLTLLRATGRRRSPERRRPWPAGSRRCRPRWPRSARGPSRPPGARRVRAARGRRRGRAA